MTTKRGIPYAAAIVASLSLSACTLAADFGRFESAELCTVALELTEFHFHAPMASLPGHPMILRLVKPPDDVGAAPSLRGLVILDRTPGPDIDIVLPNVVRAAEGPFDVDFYADVDENGEFTPTVGGAGGEDHSWTLEDVCAQRTVAFVHDTNFDGFDEPQTNTDDLTIAFVNMPVGGGALEVQLLRVATEEGVEDRTIGIYRVDAVRASELTVTLPGIVDPDPTIAYELRIWADSDEDGVYDLGEDDSWIVATDGGELAAGALGFDFELRDTNREDIGRILVTLPR
jgi:hypothetical protein